MLYSQVTHCEHEVEEKLLHKHATDFVNGQMLRRGKSLKRKVEFHRSL